MELGLLSVRINSYQLEAFDVWRSRANESVKVASLSVCHWDSLILQGNHQGPHPEHIYCHCFAFFLIACLQHSRHLMPMSSRARTTMMGSSPPSACILRTALPLKSQKLSKVNLPDIQNTSKTIEIHEGDLIYGGNKNFERIYAENMGS